VIVRYGDAPDQHGELFLPAGPGPFPVLVVLHGGFWRERYGRDLEDDCCRDLQARGFAAWNLEYRRLGARSGGGWPETFDDVAAGIDRLAAIEAPLDLRRVAAVGHSAGGHLALWAASRPKPPVAITHVVSQAGVADLAEAARLGLSDDAATELVRGDRSRFALVSPAELLPLGVPQLLVHGDADDIVPLSLAEGYLSAALAAGDEAELAVYPGGHFEHLDPASEAWAIAAGWLERRLSACGAA
jgi:acetyl esterase/lipase